MRSYVLARDNEDLKEELGSGAAEVARVVSEIRERVDVEPSAPTDPEEDRYRLLQAVSSFLRNASSVQPLLIVLEDLHDADRGTLDMLSHLARGLSGSRLLIVGTYRDVEVDRAHALSGALAELRRSSAFGRIALRGLTADEVQRMISGVAQQEVPWGLAEAVHRQTEGNPLFIQEVLRYLVEEGLLAREDGSLRSTGQTPLEMGIPEGLRDVIGKRLTRLGEECNRVLRVAAVIGRDFRLDVLDRVAEIAEDDLFAALEEAKGVGVIEERSAVGAGVTFRFAHAFFRQTSLRGDVRPKANPAPSAGGPCPGEGAGVRGDGGRALHGGVRVRRGGATAGAGAPGARGVGPRGQRPAMRPAASSWGGPDGLRRAVEGR